MNTLEKLLLSTTAALAGLAAWGSSAEAAQTATQSGHWCRSTAQSAVLLNTDDAFLAWQGDGNLVLYANPGSGTSGPKWATGTNGRASRLCMQGDGNLVIYDGYGKALWATGTENRTLGNVAIRAASGHYFAAEGNGGGTVNANRGGVGAWETFKRINHSDGTVSFRTGGNRYWVAESNGALDANRTSIGAWEKFRIINNSDGSKSLFTYHNRYVVAEGGGGGAANANRTGIGAWEKVTIVDMAQPTVNTLKMDGCTFSLRTPDGDVKWSVGGNFCASVDTSLVAEECVAGNYGIPSNALWTRSEGFGNNDFGAGYSLKAGIERDTSISANHMWTGGFADAYASIFGVRRTIFEMEASASQVGSVADSTGSLELMGFVFYDAPLAVGLSFEQDVPFFEASASFYGVQVTAALSGSLGISGSANIAGTGIRVNMTPEAAVVASASVGVGAGCVGAGVGADVTVIGVEVPVDGQIVYAGGGKLAWEVDANLGLSTLDGEIYLYLDYCLGQATHTLYDWDGLETEYNLVNQSGCI